ncbi:MAG: HEAT repeat domain-containing protein [Acidobacteriota bacterium]|nr:HEAT repeat domain-containing protein [Acidobacteriota bacterium]
MKCVEIIEQFSFYSYGEISPELEERIEAHFAACAECAAAFARHRVFMEALDGREDLAEASLLTACRMDFRRQMASEVAVKARRRGWMASLRDLAQFHIPFRIPVGALALVALGFLAARYTPEKFGGIRAGLAQPMFSSVKSIQPGDSGNVRIAVDEVQRRVVTGGLDDPRIQHLLLDAVHEESNPGLRVESIRALQNSTDSAEIRQALIETLLHDPHAGVRLKALEGLKQYAGDAAVRKAIANVLLKDDNPGVRGQAIDLLTAHHDDSIAGVLQDVMQKEDDDYIRIRCRDLLEAMKASVGTY